MPKKSKKTPLTTLKNKLWKLCIIYIRYRDKNRCQRCGKLVTGRQAHTSHVIPKSHGNVLRFDPKNLKVLCYSCHEWWHGNPIEATLWFRKKFPKRYEYLLMKKNEVVKWKTWDYEEMIKNLKEKIDGYEHSGW